MIDYLKILSKNEGFAERLYNNSLLNFYSIGQKFRNKLDQESDLVKQATHVKCYKEILFCFFTKNQVFTKLEILIKPHYYLNDNIHNANSFKAIDCINVLTEIKNIFGFTPEELPILNIEFGLNGISPIDVKDLISFSIYHNKNEFINSSDNLRFSKISFKHNNSGKANKYKQIKFYAKGLQFPEHTDPNTFRFEIKSKESKYIKTLGINTYADLLKFEIYLKLSEVTKLEFKQVLILDILNKGQNLTNKELLNLKEFCNTYKWIKSLQGSRNLFNKHKTKYFKLLNKTGNNIHSQLYNVIDSKLKELLKPCAVSTPSTKQKVGADSDVYIIGKRIQKKKRVCPITGVTLEYENGQSKYIKTTTLRYLKQSDYITYALLCSSLLADSKRRPKFESDEITHLCKQIRNRFYNSSKIKRQGFKQKQYQNQLTLQL